MLEPFISNYSGVLFIQARNPKLVGLVSNKVEQQLLYGDKHLIVFTASLLI